MGLRRVGGSVLHRPRAPQRTERRRLVGLRGRGTRGTHVGKQIEADDEERFVADKLEDRTRKVGALWTILPYIYYIIMIYIVLFVYVY